MTAETGPHLLVVDDEAGIREMLTIVFQKEGYRVSAARGCVEGLALLDGEAPDLVLTDLKMPDGTGFDILKKVRESHRDTPVVMITAYSSTKTAVDALKQGAYDYIAKPFDVDELKHVVARALERKRLVEENVALKERADGRGMGPVVGVSRKMRALFELVARIGKTTSTVLITGDSGTGKELVARAIHVASARATRPFISINCGAMPENLLESELFGHERGAFTGAVKEKKGLFHEAEGGTLFLDEIGETSLTMQVKLLRALQERVVRRVGGNTEEPIDVRIICATNKDLQKKVAEGTFREDLYYRINVIPVLLPPLRERRDDIPHRAAELLRMSERSFRYYAKKYGIRREGEETSAAPEVVEEIES
ncbi:MAG: sigma-54-dependent Fis family transcriptional regulator [Holophagales bacterium]|nr:sigma-54-dependent Fis family transcriptional regulator [Holophagales bacterium]